MLGYLPAKFKIRFLEPIDTVELGGAEAVHDKALVQTVAQEIRARIQENLARDAREAKVACGSDERTLVKAEPSRRVLVTGLSTYWGGRLAQALEGFEQIEAIIGVDSREPTLELERTEFVKVSNQHSLLQRIVRAAEIDTVIDTRLIVNSLAAPPRCAHENNVIGTMNILAACTGADSPVRKFVFKSSTHYYGSEQDDPAFFTEEMRRPHPPRTALERDMVEAEQAVAEFAEQEPRGHGDRAALRERARPRRRDRVHADVLAAAGADGARLRPAAAVRARGRRRARARARRAPRPVPGIYNVAADGVLALSEVDRPARQARRCRSCRRRAPGCSRRRCAGSASGSPTRWSTCCASAAGSTTASTRRPGFDYGYTSREAVIRLGEHLRLAPVLRGRGATRLHVRARGRGVPALEPARAARARRAEGVGRRSRAARHLKRRLADATKRVQRRPNARFATLSVSLGTQASR